MSSSRLETFFVKYADQYIKRKLIVIACLIVVFLIFINQERIFYDEHIVDGMLRKIPSTEMLAFSFCVSCFLTIILVYYALLKNVKISNGLFGACAFFMMLFVFCRFSRGYSFSPYESTGAKYLDILFIFFLAILFIKIKCWANKEESPRYFFDPFLNDVALTSSADDLFGRQKFAMALVKKIQSKIEEAAPGSLAIGINGEWGSGKTSFCNFMKEKISTKNRIVIDFNPWRSSTPQKIIIDFFELLTKELKRIDPSLSGEILRYAKTLAKIDENTITKSIETISDFLSEEENKNENYELINEAIRRSKKQIIIFIDDLDRLDKKEIIEVLRLIRNTANFTNTVYVV